MSSWNSYDLYKLSMTEPSIETFRSDNTTKIHTYRFCDLNKRGKWITKNCARAQGEV